MTTLRKQCADAAAATVAAALAPLPLYRNLDYALGANKLPAVLVEAGEGDHSEAWQREAFGGALVHFELSVSLLIARSSDPEAAADPYEAKLHAALMADTRLGGVAIDLERTGGGWDFELGHACARSLKYQVSFRVQNNNLEMAG